jgi:vacuolar-type H+-ATPase subunit I/STV1
MNDYTYNKYSVISVSKPRVDLNVPDTVVDVSVTNMNNVLVFKSEYSVGERENVFYTTDFNLLLDKIKSISNSIQVKLDEVDRLKNEKELCDKLLVDLDPELKERQRNEKRLSDVENKIDSFGTDLAEIKKYLKKILDK